MRIDKEAFKLLKKILKLNLTPEEFLDVAEWADRYRIIAKESAAVPGKWETRKTPYMFEIMKCITDTKTKKISIMSSAQVGKTELLINIIARYIDMEPCAMLMIMPTLEMAKSFSHEKLSPTIRDVKRLRKKVQMDNNDTILRKKFYGGFLKIIGANSESEMSSRSIRIVLMDEVDRFPASVGKEGDPIELADKRTTTFYNAKSIRTSTPTIKGISRIEKEFEKGSQESWALKCPECETYQVLTWEKLKWENRESETVKMYCDACGSLSTEKQWKYDSESGNLKDGKWIANFKDREEHRSFTMNALSSPWISWQEIVSKFYEAKDNPTELQTFYNTVLGLPWIVNNLDIKDYNKIFQNNRVKYTEYPHIFDLHEDIQFLTAGVDVQDNRLEIEILGHGSDGKTYGVLYQIILGNPTLKKTWQRLDALLLKKFMHAKTGAEMSVAATFVDSGYSSLDVYRFVSTRKDRNVFAIKGVGGEGKYPIIGITKIKKEGIPEIDLINLGVNALKDLVYSRLDLELGTENSCYFNAEEKSGYSLDYFKALTSEVKKIKRVNGMTKLVWEIVEGRRNEALDIRNYANAAAILIRNSHEIEFIEGMDEIEGD